MLHPSGLKGIEKFEHMCRLRIYNCGENALKLSHTLRGMEVEIKEHQKKFIAPNQEDQRIHSVLMSTNVKDIATSSKRKAPQRYLTSLGYVKGVSRILNDDKEFKRIENNLKFAASIEEMKRVDAEDALDRKRKKIEKLKKKRMLDKIAARDEKLKKKCGFEKLRVMDQNIVLTYEQQSQLNKDELRGIAFKRFGCYIVGTSKTAYVRTKVKEQYENLANGSTNDESDANQLKLKPENCSD